MLYQDLPKRWKEKLTEYLQGLGENRSVLYSADFPSNQRLHLTFSDKSHLIFNHALLIEAPKIGPTGSEIGVFTENCGYHLFSTEELQWHAEQRSDESAQRLT